MGNPMEGAAHLPCPLAPQRPQAPANTLGPWVHADLLSEVNNQTPKEHSSQ